MTEKESETTVTAVTTVTTEEPELKDDIPYELKVEADDDLADAKIHVRHAESRIHALRARLKKRHPRKAETTTYSEITSDIGTTGGTTVTTTTTTSSMSSETTVLQARLLELQMKIKEVDTMNLEYQKQLEILQGKDGVITKLQLENDELRIQVSDTDGELAKNREKAQRLENQVTGLESDAAELDTLNQGKVTLQASIRMKEQELESLQDINKRNAEKLVISNSELISIRQQNTKLSQQLVDLTGGNDELEMVRLRTEKQTLHQDLVKSGEEGVQVREENVRLQREIDDRQAQVDQLRLLLAEKDGDIVTFELQMKDLEGDSQRLAGQRELVESMSAEMKSKDVELARMKKENNQLLNSEGVLNQEVARYKFQADKKEEEIQELELKLSNFQASVKGSSSKETELLLKIKTLDQEYQVMKRKYQMESTKAEELGRENGSLSEKLASFEASNTVEIRELQAKLDLQLSSVKKLNDASDQMKKDLDSGIILRDKNDRMYRALKKMYEEEKNMGRGNGGDRKSERDLQSRIKRMERTNTEKDRELAKASELEALKAKELSAAQERIVQSGLQLTEKQTIIINLKKELAKMRRSGSKRVEDDEIQYRQTIATLESDIESWRLKAEKYEKSEEVTRRELEAQIKLLESREAMVQARDYQLSTLNQAIDLSDTAALKQAPEKKQKGSFFGIHVTSVVDHRVDDYAQPQYYKHKDPLKEYHQHVIKVATDPNFNLESEIETMRRKKLWEKKRMERMHNRRPSMS